MKTYAIGMLALLAISAVLVPAVSASGGWDCTGDPAVVQVCTAKALVWPSDCFLTTSVLGDWHGYCYA
jgi:hypothetical protein